MAPPPEPVPAPGTCCPEGGGPLWRHLGCPGFYCFRANFPAPPRQGCWGSGWLGSPLLVKNKAILNDGRVWSGAPCHIGLECLGWGQARPWGGGQRGDCVSPRSPHRAPGTWAQNHCDPRRSSGHTSWAGGHVTCLPLSLHSSLLSGHWVWDPPSSITVVTIDGCGDPVSTEHPHGSRWAWSLAWGHWPVPCQPAVPATRQGQVWRRLGAPKLLCTQSPASPAPFSRQTSIRAPGRCWPVAVTRRAPGLAEVGWACRTDEMCSVGLGY